MRTRSCQLIGLCLVALSMASCSRGDGRKPTYSVAGKVLVNGKPAEHATVVFHPIDETGANVVKPRGKVAADGSFILTTYDGHDGAPAGDYKVTVELWLSTGRSDEGPTSRLPSKYSKPETSGLTATVATGATELKSFELKR